MTARSARLVGLYLVGVIAVWCWALHHWLGGTVTTDNAADVIVFPLAWTFGFWPVVMPLLAARRVWRLQSVLERHGQRRELGLPTGEQEQEVEDTFVMLACEENPMLPKRLVRKLVQRVLRRAPRPDGEASGEPIA